MDLWKKFGRRLDGTATGIATLISQPITFLATFGFVVVWTAAAFVTGAADSWMGGMHMAGPLVTLLLVLLLQHGQAKNTRAVQLKLDELLQSQRDTKKDTVKAEKQPTGELARMERRTRRRARRSRRRAERPTKPLTKKA